MIRVLCRHIEGLLPYRTRPGAPGGGGGGGGTAHCAVPTAPGARRGSCPLRPYRSYATLVASYSQGLGDIMETAYQLEERVRRQ